MKDKQNKYKIWGKKISEYRKRKFLRYKKRWEKNWIKCSSFDLRVECSIWEGLRPEQLEFTEH